MTSSWQPESRADSITEDVASRATMMRETVAVGSPTWSPGLSHDSAREFGAILPMIPTISETLAVFMRYKQKECNLSVCTLVELMLWVAPLVVLPASGVTSLI